ncbi:MAG: O-antigen ligase family protein [Solirubrobacterales bacterium]|nr:O-antigen ligase family protein [Solirubrobacterales bacterium]
MLLAGLAVSGGGVDVLARHLSGILAWILVAVLLLGRWPDQVRPGRSLFLVGGLILVLSLLSAISSIWSLSVPSSLTEFERGIGYLGYFTASYLTMRTPKQREWFARGIGAGLAVIVVLALGERLYPNGGVEPAVGYSRLTYPLGYWNGVGICSTAGLVLFVWFAAAATDRRARAVALAMATLSGVALYLSYSRGALLAAIVAMLLLVFLSERRLRVTVVTTVVAGATAVILLTINHYPAISGDTNGNPNLGESLVVTLVALVAIALGVSAFEGLGRLARRHAPTTRRALELSKDRRLLLGIASAGIGVLLVLSLAFGNHVWDQFTDSNVPVTAEGKSRLTELSGSYRYEFNRASLDTFADHPLLGSGAGTYPIEWTQRRDIPVVSQDAHSFYLQNLAELGIPGGLISLGLVAALIGLGLIAWRRRLGRDAPAVLALTAALLLALAFDWFWKLGATAALLMLLAAWIASAEAVDPDRRRAGAGPALRVSGLLAAWASIVVLAVPAVADHYVRASADSVRADHLDKAIDQANTASELEPWSADPHMQLGVIAESLGQYARAMEEYDRAIELEPNNWHAVLLRFRLSYRREHFGTARKDFERLRELYPFYFGRSSFDEVRQPDS